MSTPQKVNQWKEEEESRYLASDSITTDMSFFRRSRGESDQEKQQTTMMQIDGTGPTLNYRAMQAITVSSDDAPHKTTMAILDLPAKLDYLAIPKKHEHAILRAKITNLSDFTLLPGSALIFDTTEYMGKTQMKTVSPNEDFVVAIAIEDRVRIQRKLIDRAILKVGDGQVRQLIYTYKITLKNYLTTPATITVRDQLPVSLQETIKVLLQEVTPQPMSHSELNILKWVIELPSQETRDIIFIFSIEYPQDVELSGI